MLKDILAGRIQIADKAENWKKAIAMVIEPMQKDGVVEERYLQAIYENDKKYLTIAFDITRKEAGSFINMASVDDLQILGGGKGE